MLNVSAGVQADITANVVSHLQDYSAALETSKCCALYCRCQMRSVVA